MNKPRMTAMPTIEAMEAGPSVPGLPAERVRSLREYLVAEAAAPTPARVGLARLFRTRRRRIAAAVAGSALAVALAGAGYQYAATRRPATYLTSIGCYASVSAEADAAIVVPGVSPTETCAEIWASGEMVEGRTDVPPLTACVNDWGALAVVPSDTPGVCASIGMADWENDGAFSALGPKLLWVRSELFWDWRERCVGEDEARADARRLLDAAGLHDWQIEVGKGGHPPSGGRCATPVEPSGDDGVFHITLVPPGKQ